MDKKNPLMKQSEATEQKEKTDKFLLSLETVIGIISVMVYFAAIIIFAFTELSYWLKVLILILGFITLFVGVYFTVKIEQIAGYYECQVCGHRYVPTYFSVLFAPHINRTRYMKCPHCNKKSWQKKVISKK